MMMGKAVHEAAESREGLLRTLVRRSIAHQFDDEIDAADELAPQINDVARKIDDLDGDCEGARLAEQYRSEALDEHEKRHEQAADVMEKALSGLEPQGDDSPETRATRAYLTAMVAAGYEIELVDRTPITVDQAVEELAKAGRERTGTTINIGKLGGSYFNINGWL